MSIASELYGVEHAHLGMSDLQAFWTFCPALPDDGFAERNLFLFRAIRESREQSRRPDGRVELLARFYAEYESAEVSPFDSSEDTDVLD